MSGRYEENTYPMRMMKIVGDKDTKLYGLDGFDRREMAKPVFEPLLGSIGKKMENIKG